MLDIAPGLEREFTQRAEAHGMTSDQYLTRLLTLEATSRTLWQAPAPDHAADTQRAAIHALLTLPPDEIARRNAPSAARLEARLAETSHATPEEIAQAETEWERHKQRMNAHRAATGERPVFADVSSAKGDGDGGA